MKNICRNYAHYLCFEYERTTNICLSCVYNNLGKSEYEFKKYIIQNIKGAKCPNSLCEVTMGAGWIGSHHGGPRMKCGSCSSYNHYHPGMSDSGYEIFNYILCGKSNISAQDKAEISERLAKENEEMERIQIQQKNRKEAIERDRQRDKRIQQEEQRISDEAKYLKQYNEQMKRIKDTFDHVVKYPDDIMRNVTRKGHLIQGYVFHFVNNACFDATYEQITLREIHEYVCCFKIKHKSQKVLHELFMHYIKRRLGNLEYTKDTLAQSFCDMPRWHIKSNELYKNCFLKNGYVPGLIEKKLLLYRDGKFGLIDIFT